MNNEYEMRETFEDRGSVSGIVLMTGDRITKLELRDGVGEIVGDCRKLLKLRDLVEKALLDYEKSADRRV
jgi:hypothetical protein